MSIEKRNKTECTRTNDNSELLYEAQEKSKELS